MVTSWFWASSSSTTCDPMNPDPPVTSTFIAFLSRAADVPILPVPEVRPASIPAAQRYDERRHSLEAGPPASAGSAPMTPLPPRSWGYRHDRADHGRPT